MYIEGSGLCIDTFKGKLSGLYEDINNKKESLSDPSIDLLNPLDHNTTTKFINSSHSATLIDNIFNNVIDKIVVRGLLINDKSDQLLVFAVIQICIRTNKDNKTNDLIRYKTQDAINYFKDQMKQDCNKIYVEDVNEAYETVLSITIAL